MILLIIPLILILWLLILMPYCIFFSRQSEMLTRCVRDAYEMISILFSKTAKTLRMLTDAYEMLTRAYGRHAKSTFHTWVRLIFKSKPNVRFVSQVLKVQKLTKAYEVLTRAYERHAKSILWIVKVIPDGLCSFCPSVKEWPPLIILLRRGFLKQVIYVHEHVHTYIHVYM